MSAHHPHTVSRRQAALWLAGLVGTTSVVAAPVNPATVPEPKRSKAGLYVEARDVPGFFEARGGAARVLFIDVRTRAEAMFVGMATGVDALVPFVELQELMTDWDDSAVPTSSSPCRTLLLKCNAGCWPSSSPRPTRC